MMLNAPRWTRPGATPLLGVAMIVKDEVANLPALLASIADIADEVVIVDTGSTDGTIALCKHWGVRLFSHRWRDDFAAARNAGFDAARARYLLWLDADDRVPAATAAGLRAMRDRLRDEPLRALRMTLVNVDARGARRDGFAQLRVVPRLPGVRFAGRVHEELASSVAAAGVPVEETTLEIHHVGYADPAVTKAKAARNERLLRQAAAERPDDVHVLLHLAQALAEQGRFQEADARITEAVAHAQRQGYGDRLLAECHVLRSIYRDTLGNALGATFDLEAASRLQPGWGVPQVLLAKVKLRSEDVVSAREAAERARAGSFAAGIMAFDATRLRTDADFYLARAERTRGDGARAEALLREAIARAPDHLDARLELGDLLLERDAFADARFVLEPAGDDETALPRFVEVASAIGLARAGIGDHAGAGACLGPLVDVFALELGGVDSVGPLELAAAMVKHGEGRAAKRMLRLAQLVS